MPRKIQISIETVLSDKGLKDTIKGLGLVERASVNAAKSQAVLAQAQARSDAAYAKSAQSAAKISAEQTKAAISAAKLATETTKVATANERLAQSAIKTATDLSRQEAQQNRTALSALRLEQAQDRASKPALRLGEAVGKLQGALGAVGIAAGTAQIVQFGVESGKLALATDQADRSLKALAGSPILYADALAAAREQQRLFGGSLQENISGVQGLITVSRDSGIELKKLIDLSQRLAVKDPAQGAQGARIALQEAFSGDPTSLAKRYEIPKAALAALRDESTTASEKLQILDTYLNKIGITSETVAGSVPKATIAFNSLGQAIEDVQIKGGGAGANILAPFAAATTQLLGGSADFQSAGEAMGQTLADITGKSGESADAMRIATGVLTEYVTVTQGVTAEASSVHQVFDLTSGAALRLNSAIAALPPGAQALMSAFLGLGRASEENAGAANQSTTAYGAYSAAAVDAEGRTQAYAQATESLATKLVTETENKLKSAQAASELAAFQADLANLAGRVASGHLTTGQAAIIMAGKWHVAGDEAIRLIGLQAQLAGGLAGTLGNQKKTYGQNREEWEMRKAGAGASDASTTAQQFVKGQQAQAAATQAAREAQKQYNLAMSEGAAKTAILTTEYDNATRAYGEGSAESIRAKLALDQHTASQIKSAGASGAAGRAATSRANAEAAASDKIIDLAEATAAKLAEIDEKAAQRRIKAAQDLANSIRATSADLIADQEANDLQLIGASEDQLPDLIAREEAEGQARIATIEAISEARRIADEGDAELAQDVLDQRSAAISKQQALDEEYNKKKQEFAEDPAALDALKKEYDEATAAAQAATQVRIDLAKQEAEQRIASMEAEKQAVLDDATARAAAMDSTGKNAATAQERVDDLAAALRNIPTAVTTTVTVNEVRTGGGGSSSSAPPSTANAAAGGGSFLTNRPTQLTVGDNPGGVELVQVTPLSGTGQTRVGSGMIKLAGGGSVVGDAADSAIDALTNAPGAAIPAARAASGGGSGGGGGGGGSAQADVKDELDAIKAAIDLLKAMAELRSELATVGPPINMEVVNALASEALAATQALGAKFVPLTKEQGELFEIFTDAIGNALSTLSDAAGLRGDLVDIGPPMDQKTVARLAYEAEQALYGIRSLLRPIGEQQAEEIERFTDSASNALGVLSDAASLRKEASEIGPPMDPTMIARLASEARAALDAIRGTLIPIGEEEADAVGRYADSVGASVGALGDALDLSAKRFLDYQSPSDAQLSAVTTDARRFIDVMNAAAAMYSKEGMESTKAYAEAISATYGAVSEGLTTIDKLRFSDVSVDTAKLAQFSDATSQILIALSSLSAQAAAIPPSQLTALTGATAAYNAVNESLITAAAVPYGNLGQIAGNAGGGGASSVTVNIYNPPANLDVTGLKQQITDGISRAMRSHK